jgi:hypothetical protein
MSKSFLWEEYAAEENDRGVEVLIPHHGEMLPFRIKRVLTIDERQRANEAGVELEIDSKGRPRLKRQNQAAFTKEVVLIGLKAWPFEYEPGKSVPITAKTVARLEASLLDEIASRILGIVEVNKEDLDPFGMKSDAAS